MRKAFLTCLILLLCPVLFAQEMVTNDAVIKLVKAGLSEELVVTTINSSPGNYDTSVNALIALKKAGACDKVIAAIILKASGAAPATRGRPRGAGARRGRRRRARRSTA